MTDTFYRLFRGLRLLPLVLLGLALALVLFMTEAGRFVSSPTDEPVKADLIVVLGGGKESRDVRGSELWRAGYAPHIFLTEIVSARLNLLADLGVPTSAILTDNQSRSSWDEAMTTYKLMRGKGWKSALIVSDPEHMRRLSWTWKHVFVGSGMTFRLIPAPMPDWDAAHWWRDEGSARYVKEELVKLVFYLFRYGSEGPEYELPTVRAGK